MKLDAKSIAAIAALVAALAGGVELRVQVGLLAAKVDQVAAEQARVRADLDRISRMSRNEE